MEERTFSTLQPQRIGFEPFTGEEIYEFLADRARKSLKPRSLRRKTLTYIASSTQNLKVRLTWLRVSAHHAEDAMTETLVKEVKEEVSQTYTKHWLQKLTDHHRLPYQAIEELDTEQGKCGNATPLHSTPLLSVSQPAIRSATGVVGSWSWSWSWWSDRPSRTPASRSGVNFSRLRQKEVKVKGTEIRLRPSVHFWTTWTKR